MSTVQVLRDPNTARARIRKALRESLDGEALMLSIQRCHQMLLDGREGITNAATGEVTYVELGALRTTQIGKALDVQFRLLNKILPDLKSIEMTSEAAAGPQGSRDKMVLATKLLAIWREEDAAKADPEWLS